MCIMIGLCKATGGTERGPTNVPLMEGGQSDSVTYHYANNLCKIIASETGDEPVIPTVVTGVGVTLGI